MYFSIYVKDQLVVYGLYTDINLRKRSIRIHYEKNFIYQFNAKILKVQI